MDLLVGAVVAAIAISIIVLLLGAGLAACRSRRGRRRSLVDGGGPPLG